MGVLILCFEQNRVYKVMDKTEEISELSAMQRIF
jgi:hypothetical protein